VASFLKRFFRSERSQSLTEFALVAPILFFILFGIVDFGRAVYYYVTISQAANEGARVAIVGEPPDYLQSTDADVIAAVLKHSIAAQLGDPCPNGPIPSSPSPPANTGYVYVTAYPPYNYQETPSPRPNAPGAQGQLASSYTSAGCDQVNAASGNTPLQVTIYYNFQPITPLLQNVLGGHILLSSWAVYQTEY
jgi:hypothetical protein